MNITPDFTKVRLGKQDYVADPRTLKAEMFMRADLRTPDLWDFDKNRAPFPIRTWNNTLKGDCVVAGQANQLMRFERLEQKRTISLLDSDAVTQYEKESIRQFGSYTDNGLVVLYNLRDWRNFGWEVSGMKDVRWPRTYKISAYGEIEPLDRKQIRMAMYYLQGVQCGFSLPLAAQAQTNNRLWDYNGQTGPEWQPGGWGGHLVYAKAYDPETIEVMTWGMKVRVTNAFFEKYVDECWAVVDSLDTWRAQQTIKVEYLNELLNKITSKVNQ